MSQMGSTLQAFLNGTLSPSDASLVEAYMATFLVTQIVMVADALTQPFNPGPVIINPGAGKAARDLLTSARGARARIDGAQLKKLVGEIFSVGSGALTPRTPARSGSTEAAKAMPKTPSTAGAKGLKSSTRTMTAAKKRPKRH